MKMPPEEGLYPGGDKESRDGRLQIAGALVSCPCTPCFSQKNACFCAKRVGCVRSSGCAAAIDSTSGQQELSLLWPALPAGGGLVWCPPPHEGTKQHPRLRSFWMWPSVLQFFLNWLLILLFLLYYFSF